MKKIIALLFLLSLETTFGQIPDSLKNKWIPTFVAGLGINQIAFSNWVKGGDNSIAWTLLGDLHYDKIGTPWTFKNSIKVTYGRSKIGSETYRTTDNDLYVENVAVRDVGWVVSPFISNSIRTQIAKGFDYKVEPAVEIANFFDPGYMTQTIGFTYDKYSNVITRLGVGFQEIFTNRFRQYSDPINLADRFKFEIGIESVTDINYKIDDNIVYSGKMRFFSQFKSLDVWDVRLDNVIAAKVTKYISVNFTYLVIYEKVQSPYTQVKEGLQIGIVYNIL
ncbi:MAG: DUF3078 domain-containing protein [Ignavibacteriales bacterium]|nr:DUF3078 domain-containing protein [Ignavibacteriales bacterium]